MGTVDAKERSETAFIQGLRDVPAPFLSDLVLIAVYGIASVFSREFFPQETTQYRRQLADVARSHQFRKTETCTR